MINQIKTDIYLNILQHIHTVWETDGDSKTTFSCRYATAFLGLIPFYDMNHLLYHTEDAVLKQTARIPIAQIFFQSFISPLFLTAPAFNLVSKFLPWIQFVLQTNINLLSAFQSKIHRKV